MTRRKLLGGIVLWFFVFAYLPPKSIAESPKSLTNSIGMKLVLIPKGTFSMGSPASETGTQEDERPHEVTLSKNFYMGAFEVTQSQYKFTMGEYPSRNQGNGLARDALDNPVEQVSWQQAIRFCELLSALPEEKKAGRVYRLPTEAEWEYACRAGSNTAYHFGESSKNLEEFAWFAGNTEFQTYPVGKKKPNPWGLYDMHGNVKEWCSDWYGDYLPQTNTKRQGTRRTRRVNPNSPIVFTDPEGPANGNQHISRGGSYRMQADSCRSATRNPMDVVEPMMMMPIGPPSRFNYLALKLFPIRPELMQEVTRDDIGFRVVFSAKE